MFQKLFPTDLTELEWTEFSALGFSEPVCGVIYRNQRPPCCGVPVGGIGTGCLDIDGSGVIGFNTIFNSFVPRQKPRFSPLLGLSVGEEVWVLATEKVIRGGALQACTRPRAANKVVDEDWTVQTSPIEGVKCAREIHYWGHYPVADLEYETDAPVSVGLRAWAPFIPGDLAASSIPGAIFEIHLRNTSGTRCQGTVAFDFSGPTEVEAGTKRFRREDVVEGVRGVQVTGEGDVGYVLGVIGEEAPRLGGSLGADGAAWTKISSQQPAAPADDPGASLAIDFDLQPDEARTARVVLAWYAPQWQGEKGNCYRQMYTIRYRNSLDVARRLAAGHALLLKRILAWQGAIYGEREIPGWLSDSLINHLCLMTETSIWALPQPPLGDSRFPGGVYGQYESPRSCANIECIPCSWYGNLPLNYFFPELSRSTLKGFTEFMREDGAPPFALGVGMELIPRFSLYEYQAPLNGVCFVDMVDRLWQCTADDTVVSEFYAAVKKSTTWTMNQVPGPEGVISVTFDPAGGKFSGTPKHWYEHMDWYGMCAHVAGLRLSNLKIAQRMAEKMKDRKFADQCQQWFDQGSRALEENLWNDKTLSYLRYSDPERGKISDEIMASQFDGEWANHLHGLPGVFRAERVEQGLTTIKRTCLVEIGGAVGFADADGTPQLTSYGIFPPQTYLVGMTYIYKGDRETGLEIVRKCLYNNVIRHPHPWDLPNLIRCDTGERTFGTDYNQNMLLWAMPAAMAGQDLSTLCGPDGFVGRVIEAGRDSSVGISMTFSAGENTDGEDIFAATRPENA